MTPEEIEHCLVTHFPTHSRSSCSDDSPTNDHTTEGRGGAPRCSRCALLRAIRTGEHDGIVIQTHVDVYVRWSS